MEPLHVFGTILIPLVIIMDPLGNLPFFLLFTEHNTLSEQRRIAAFASLTACLILLFFSLSGDFILGFFGITLPAFQIAGGIIFFIYSLQLLNLIPSGLKTSREEKEEGVQKENVTLVPLATPLLAGPGAITAVMVWRETADLVHDVILLFAIFIACLLVYLVFLFGRQITRTLGLGGIRVLTRLMGLLLSVIAVQFMLKGFQQIVTAP
jgi:multiple antibiotic resistance protein